MQIHVNLNEILDSEGDSIGKIVEDAIKDEVLRHVRKIVSDRIKGKLDEIRRRVHKIAENDLLAALSKLEKE